MKLALAHAHARGTGLASILEAMLAPVQFGALVISSRALLLAEVPSVLRSLPTNRATATLQLLPLLVSGGNRGVGSSGSSSSSSSGGGGSSSGSGGGGGGSSNGRSGNRSSGASSSRFVTGTGSSVSGSGGGGGGGGGGDVARLQVAAWEGLQQLCRAQTERDAFMTSKVGGVQDGWFSVCTCTCKPLRGVSFR